MKKTITHSLILVLLLLAVPITSANENVPLLTQNQLDVYKSYSDKQCLNVLVNTVNEGIIYNGKYLEEAKEDGYGFSDAHIAGDRLGYLNNRFPYRVPHVIIDGKDYGAISEDISHRPNAHFVLNKNHFAFLKIMKPKSRDLHVIFDGTDLGIVDAGFLKLNGDQVLYRKTIAGKSHVFANGRDLGEGSLVDYDGTHLAIVKENDDLIYDGRRVANLGESAGFLQSISVKDGHLAYNKGSNTSARVFYDGKDRGKGVTPVVEKNHLAFNRGAGEGPVVYDGKEYGKNAGNDNHIHLAGDHFAFMKKANDGLATVNIDGKDLPGLFAGYTTYVEISPKVKCSAAVPATPSASRLKKVKPLRPLNRTK